MVIRLVKLGNAENDERMKSSGGQAGDQTTKEVRIRDWYNRTKGWSHVIRPKDANVAEKIAKAMEQACTNEHIGYDQNQRTTLFFQAKNCKWDLSKITVDCETDCSALVSVCVNAAGISVSKDMYTGNELEVLKKTGKFDIITEFEYLTSSDYLRRGDILLGSGHTAVVLSNGNKYTSTQTKADSGRSGAFLVRILANALNVRAGAGTSYKVNRVIHKGEVYTITETTTSGSWGKLKSGAGWISLNPKYTQRV